MSASQKTVDIHPTLWLSVGPARRRWPTTQPTLGECLVFAALRHHPIPDEYRLTDNKTVEQNY